MGQILHGSARTTAVVRKAIQESKETITVLAERYDINPKTVIKWRRRGFVHDAPMGPSRPRSTVLSPEEEAVCILFRKHTLLPLDDCLYALQDSIPHLSPLTIQFTSFVSTPWHKPLAGYWRQKTR